MHRVEESEGRYSHFTAIFEVEKILETPLSIAQNKLTGMQTYEDLVCLILVIAFRSFRQQGLRSGQVIMR